MPDILLAISQALAGVPGLAPVFSPLVAMREDEKAKEASALLLAKITDGEEITREALEGLLIEVLGARAENRVIHEQMVSGFYAVLALLCVPANRSSRGLAVRRPDLLTTSTSTAQAMITDLLDRGGPVLAREGLVTREAVQEELVKRFSGEVKVLLAIAYPVGFPKGFVPQDVAPIQAYSTFLQVFDGLPRGQRQRIAGALARKIPGSTLLSTWAVLSGSYADEDR